MLINNQKKIMRPCNFIKIDLPEYYLASNPDFASIGRKADIILEKQLPDGHYVCRAIGSQDHPHLTINKLEDLIILNGSDKYDLSRKEICYEEFSDYDHDFQGGSFSIFNHKILNDDEFEFHSLFGDIFKKFYVNTLMDRGYQVRIDFLLIYKQEDTMKAERRFFNKPSVRLELFDCLFKFKEKNRGRKQLYALVKIIR